MQVFDDAGGQRAGGWEVVGVFEAFVAQPEEVEAELVAFEQFVVAEGVETLALLALVVVFGVVAGHEVVEVGARERIGAPGCMLYALSKLQLNVFRVYTVGLTAREEATMNDHYLPVPVWNSRLGHWEPVDFRHGQHVTIWPEEIDVTRLPQPEYRDEDRVQFVRDETCAREGVVRMVMLLGGAYGPLDRVEELIEQWYCHPESMVYIVTARGHDHRIRPSAILGQFVSRHRWER